MLSTTPASASQPTIMIRGSLVQAGSIGPCELASGGAPDAATRSTHPAGVALHLAGGGGRHHRPERVGRDAPEEHLVPDSPVGPAPEAPLDRVRLAEPLRQPLPRWPGTRDVDDALGEPARGGAAGRSATRGRGA